MNTPKVPKALKEVWQCKDEAWHEVAHLPIREAVLKRIADANKNAEKQRGKMAVQKESHPMVAAEGHAEYCARRQTKKRESGDKP